MILKPMRALQVPLIVPYKALGNFPKALYRTMGGTYSAHFFHPVMRKDLSLLAHQSSNYLWFLQQNSNFH